MCVHAHACGHLCVCVLYAVLCLCVLCNRYMCAREKEMGVGVGRGSRK